MAKFNPNDYLIQLQGNKAYLPVAFRLLWLDTEVREEEIGGYEILTELMDQRTFEDTKRKRTVNEAVFKATIVIRDVHDKEVRRVTGWGSETDSDFADYREKAETKAIGRAVALAGYGTQHAPEFDEGDRPSPFLDEDGNRGPVGLGVVDGPTEPSKTVQKEKLSKITKAKAKKEKASPKPEQREEPDGEELTPEQQEQRKEYLKWLGANSENPVVSDLLKAAVVEVGDSRVTRFSFKRIKDLYDTAVPLLNNA